MERCKICNSWKTTKLHVAFGNPYTTKECPICGVVEEPTTTTTSYRTTVTKAQARDALEKLWGYAFEDVPNGYGDTIMTLNEDTEKALNLLETFIEEAL